MSKETIKSIIESLSQIKEDISVPKNVRIKMENTIKALQDESKNVKVKVDGKFFDGARFIVELPILDS